MGDRVKERDRKGWKERGINYQSSGGRRERPITPYLSGIYNYIMMHPLSHQVNRQSLSCFCSHSLFSLSSPCISPSFHHILFSLCLPFLLLFLSPDSKEKSGSIVCNFSYYHSELGRAIKGGDTSVRSRHTHRDRDRQHPGDVCTGIVSGLWRSWRLNRLVYDQKLLTIKAIGHSVNNSIRNKMNSVTEWIDSNIAVDLKIKVF